MTTFITQGCFSNESMKAMLAKPEDRAAALSKVLSAAGGKLIGYYVTFGEYDFLIIAEAPSEEAMLSGLIVAGASGSVTNLKTMVAVSSAQAMKAFESAKGVAASYRAPGKA
jgi:uncharacterized protein with GYD domain